MNHTITKPGIILTTVHHIVNVYCVVLDLIDEQIPLIHEHFAVFIGGQKGIAKPGTTFEQLLQEFGGLDHVHSELVSRMEADPG